MGFSQALAKLGKTGLATVKDGTKMSNTLNTFANAYSAYNTAFGKNGNTGIAGNDLTARPASNSQNNTFGTVADSVNWSIVGVCAAVFAVVVTIICLFKKKRRRY